MAQVVSPLLVPETQQLATLNYVYGGLAVLCELAVLVCVTRWVGEEGGKGGICMVAGQWIVMVKRAV